MRKILISGYYGFGNFGDELILKILLDKFKDCDVTVLTSNPRKTFDTYGVHTVYSFSMEHVMKELIYCDVLVSGGGSLLQNVTSNKSLFYYSSIIMMAQAFGKDVLIFAQGIGPIKGFLPNHVVKSIMKKAKYISVRDEKSLALLNKWKIKNANLVCDPAYSLEVEQPQRTQKVCIQLRRSDNLTDELFDKIVQQVKLRYYSREIELLSLQDEMDVGISQVFINKLKKADPNINVKLVSGLNIQETIDRISEYDCMIAMRFHACLVGVKYGVKTLAIAYDPKVEILAKENNLPMLSVKSSENDYDKAFDTMENLSRWNLMEKAKSKKFDWNKTGVFDAKKEVRKSFWGKKKDNNKDKKKNGKRK